MTTRYRVRPLLRHALDKLLPGESWAAWRCAIAAGLALPPESDWEVELFKRCTRRTCWPTRLARKIIRVVGRRGGKTRAATAEGVIRTGFADYSDVLAPGEWGVLMMLGADRRQGRILRRYADGFIESAPPLARKVIRRTADVIEFDTNISLEVATADFRTVRGFTAVGVICDETAFWPTDDSANPDSEIVSALLPALATTGGPLILISTPYAQRGVVFEYDRDYFGRDDDDVLVWKADSRTMNPTLPEQLVLDAYREDEAAAASEYGRDGEIHFRADIESLFSPDAVRAVTVAGRIELPPRPAGSHRAFGDFAGGSGTDSFTVAISHSDVTVAVLDCLREWRPPFSPEAVVAECSDLLKAYGVKKILADKYAGQWAVEMFAKYGITCEQTAASKSELYSSFVAAVNSQRVELLDNPRLRAQLLALERRTGRSGRDSIDHGPRGFDDIANVAAGALAQSAAGRLVLPADFSTCWYEVNHGRNMAAYGGCFIFQNGGTFLPSGDPSCSECPAWTYVKAAYADHVARGGERVGVRDFHQRYVGLNQWAWIRRESWALKQIL